MMKMEFLNNEKVVSFQVHRLVIHDSIISLPWTWFMVYVEA